MPPHQNGRLLKHFQVDVTASGREYLAYVLEIAFSDLPGFGIEAKVLTFDHATHLLLEGGRQMTFFRAFGDLKHPWNQPSERFAAVMALPEPIRAHAAASMAWDWLKTADFGDDENDGATYRGWRVFNHEHGMVDGHWDAFVAIRPMWIYLPK